MSSIVQDSPILAAPATADFRLTARGGQGVIRAWLVLLGLLVYAMILVGGATRLTDSGLSITEWAPISGTLPPLSEAAWQSEFDKYRLTAEYQTQNFGMTLPEFQFIYYWEWGHRLLGRLIGLVAVGGVAFFALRRWLTGRLALRLTGLVALGGLQGLIGWWMVASGIGDTTRVDVAPYRLMVHFTLALFIICVIAWTWLDMSPQGSPPGTRSERGAAWVLLGLIGFQMAAGALVAGLDAGRSYTDWPMMAGEVFPADYWRADYGLRNPFENRATVQFNHRMLAYVLMVAAVFYAWRMRKSASGRLFLVVAALVCSQAAWGVLTLVYVAPLNLALVHQGLGVVVLLASVWLAWRNQRTWPQL